MALLELGVLHVKCGSSCKMLHTFVTMLVPPVGIPTPVIGGEGRCIGLFWGHNVVTENLITYWGT